VKLAIALTVALIACAATASAQEATTGGLKVGANLSTFKVTPNPPDTSNRTGFVLGVFTRSPFSRRFALLSEFQYSQKGAKIREGGREVKVKIDYFEVPILLDVRLNHTGPARASLVIGPHYGIRLKAKEDGRDIKQDVKKLDIGLIAGLGVSVGDFVFDGRYTWGLKDIENGAGVTKNRTVGLSIGWKFR
jgi:hypothetical protein